MITFILAVCGNVDYVYSFPQSPPSRAAWIEIIFAFTGSKEPLCRRLHGRRGLKCPQIDNLDIPNPSPPSRAAWIEIRDYRRRAAQRQVAAFTGGVD